jgi:uncharacterized protein YukE
MGFAVPPTADFTAYSNLLQVQRGHLGTLGNYAGTECDNTEGLDNLLSVLRGPINDLSLMLNNKLFQCQGGMGNTAGKILDARQNYSDSDKRAETKVKAAYPAALPGFQEIPGGPLIGNFDDVDIKLKTPDEPEDPIKIHLIAIRGPLSAVEHVWQWASGGDSLLARLVTPITGSYTRLKYLQEAYDQLAQGTYTVTGNVRRGTWRLAAEWNGEAATAFESYLFRWHMGMGGLGDAATVASNLLRDGYITITVAVDAILKKISDLIENEIEELAKQAGEMIAGDAAIEVVGGGPEDPVADVVALGFSIYKMYKIYKIVRKIITAISVIETLIKGAQKLVEELGKAVNEVHTLLATPMEDPSTMFRDMMNGVENKGVEFEKDGFWKPAFGAKRIGMLPAA